MNLIPCFDFVQCISTNHPMYLLHAHVHHFLALRIKTCVFWSVILVLRTNLAFHQQKQILIYQAMMMINWCRNAPIMVKCIMLSVSFTRGCHCPMVSNTQCYKWWFTEDCTWLLPLINVVVQETLHVSIMCYYLWLCPSVWMSQSS